MSNGVFKQCYAAVCDAQAYQVQDLLGEVSVDVADKLWHVSWLPVERTVRTLVQHITVAVSTRRRGATHGQT